LCTALFSICINNHPKHSALCHSGQMKRDPESSIF
jgi:hypothetical protein